MKTYFLVFAFNILLFTLSALSVIAQKQDLQYNHSVGIQVFKGFVYKHSDDIGHLTKNNPTGFEIYYNKLTNGNKSWEAINNYPEVGVSLGYYNYHDEVLGSTIAALFHIQYYLTKSRTGHSFKIHIGTGLGFNTHPYNAETNNKNTVLGSTVTFALQPRFIYSYTTKSNWIFTASPNLTHFSNGSVKKPNKGINILTFHVGVGKIIGERVSLTDPPGNPSFDKNIKVDLTLYSGMRNNSEGKMSYPFITFGAAASKRFGIQGGVTSGIDLFYSIALKEEIKNDIQFSDGKYPDFKRLGWFIGYEWYISRVSIIAQFGYYIYRPYKQVPPVYQRIGLKFYNKQEKIFLAANLKTHAGTAEMAEFGIGLRF